MKVKLVILFAIILSFTAIKYVWDEPKKFLYSEIQWTTDNSAKKVVPIFAVYYCWNAQKDRDPTWMVLPKHGKWLVLDLRKAATSKPQDVLNYTNNFNSEWIETKQFQGKPDRYELLLITLGFEPFWEKERKELRGILRGTRDFDMGQLKQDDTIK